MRRAVVGGGVINFRAVWFGLVVQHNGNWEEGGGI